MGLQDYEKKRDFGKTPEPRGREHATGGTRRFVVQKHAASRLHYDFRLEEDGVLKSWAVPKGPSLDPGARRLAVEVEDHPVEYGEFEGTIPEGEYGGGTVLLWDRGRWEPAGDVAEGLRNGRLRFHLDGEKLQGGFSLVRIRGRDGDRRNWLLMKSDDEHARRDGDVLDLEPRSVASGRDMDAIASARAHFWHSNRPAGGRKQRRTPRRRVAPPEAAPRAPMPAAPTMQLPTLVAEAPDGDDWIHEIKLDGYRVFCRIEEGKARLVTRGGQDWTARFGLLAEAAAELPVKSALLDGEVVALDAEGRSSFQGLQRAMQSGTELHLYLFDILHLDGRDLASLPLHARKEKLAEIVTGRGRLRLSEHVEGQGPRLYTEACRAGAEGIVSKQRDAPYAPGRSRSWLKVKCVKEQELVIGGYTDPRRSRAGIGALLVGYHEGRALRYAGKVGTGFTGATLASLATRLAELEVAGSPFAQPPRLQGAHWVRPELVAQVGFTEWTGDGKLRHPVFRGLREDKPAREVVRESARPGTAPAEISGARTARRSPRRVAPAATARAGEVAVFPGIELSHPDKVLYPEQGITKRDLAEYFVAVGDWLLPHVVGRPLTLLRCPEGRRSGCFFQKHWKPSTPDAIRPLPIAENDGTPATYMMVEDLAGVVALVQLGVLEIHPWGSRHDAIETPDRIVLDLDPAPELPWARVCAAARDVRARLRARGLESWVKTTGGKGLHVVAPVLPQAPWDVVRQFCRELAEEMARDRPDLYVSKASKAARKGKVFVDWLRNGRGATSVAAYAVRARDGAPVSLPLRWEEIGRAGSKAFSIANVPARLRRLRGDPWEGFRDARQVVTAHGAPPEPAKNKKKRKP